MADWKKAHPGQVGEPDEVTRWCAERTAAAALSGNQNRRAAGTATGDALRMLGAILAPDSFAMITCGPPDITEVARSSAELDLEADPSCAALDAAREALRGAREEHGWAGLTTAEQRAWSRLLVFEACTMAAVDALRGQVVQVLRLAQLGQQLEGPFGGDALTGGAEGLRLACRVYRQGPKCMGSFARAHWIVAGAVRALRGVWSDTSEAARSGVALLSLDHTVTEQDAHDVERGQGGVVAHGVIGNEGPEALMLRWERGADLRATVEAASAELPADDREKLSAYLEGRRSAPLSKRIVGALRDLIGDVGPGEVFA